MADDDHDADASKQSCLKTCDDGSNAPVKLNASFGLSDPVLGPVVAIAWNAATPAVLAPSRMHDLQPPSLGPPVRVRYSRLALYRLLTRGPERGVRQFAFVAVRPGFVLKHRAPIPPRRFHRYPALPSRPSRTIFHSEFSMKHTHSLSLVLAIVAFSAPTWAAQDDQHQAHHPASAASTPASKATPEKASPDMARMDSQMKAMQEMHLKMMAAKTPEERAALMADHMKAMQDGMAMMSGMSPGDMGGMVGMKSDMAGRHQMMERRMEMMQTMMQMMVDRLPMTPIN